MITAARHDTNDILIVGVGGQGIILAADILAEMLVDQGFDVKEAEIHGMSQRGGSVHSMIRYGKSIASPMISEGGAAFVLAFEELEALRWASYARSDAKFIVNKQRIPPIPVAIGVAEYPEDVIGTLRKDFKNVADVDAIGLAKKAGDVRAANVVMLGLLARGMPFDKAKWLDAIKKRVPSKTLDVNRKAFQHGWDA